MPRGIFSVAHRIMYLPVSDDQLCIKEQVNTTWSCDVSGCYHTTKAAWMLHYKAALLAYIWRNI